MFYVPFEDTERNRVIFATAWWYFERGGFANQDGAMEYAVGTVFRCGVNTVLKDLVYEIHEADCGYIGLGVGACVADLNR